jgi:hypothetical protein
MFEQNRKTNNTDVRCSGFFLLCRRTTILRRSVTKARSLYYCSDTRMRRVSGSCTLTLLSVCLVISHPRGISFRFILPVHTSRNYTL